MNNISILMPVSIQLVSPASGERIETWPSDRDQVDSMVSIQLVSPASGEEII